MAQIVCIRGPGVGKKYSLQKDLLLGRSPDCDVYISDLNISRHHARIRQINKELILEDLGSGNGTFVNNQPIIRYRLKHLDVFDIGGSSFRYEMGDMKMNWPAEILTVLTRKDMPAKGGYLHPFELAPIRFDLTTADEITNRCTDLPEARVKMMLEAMLEISDVIATELKLDLLLDKILNHLFQLFPQAERGYILLIDSQTGQLIPHAIKQRKANPRQGFIYSPSIVNQVIEQGVGVIRRRHQTTPLPVINTVDKEDSGDMDSLETEAITVVDPRPENFNPQQTPTPLTTYSQPRGEPKMATPLICQSKVLGSIHLEATTSFFSAEDLSVFSALGRQAALAIANAQAGQTLLAQQRLEDDLNLAHQIQRCFLPRKLPQMSEVEICSHYLPALQVGGDFFDIVQIDREHIGILVGDVAGKGISAALLMAKITSELRALSRTHRNPGEVLSQANQALMESGLDSMFATVVYLILDLKKYSLTLANAGHQPPIIIRSSRTGHIEIDDATAVALGIMPNIKYGEATYQLGVGDSVLLYTDGINEALNLEGKDYGMDRLRKVITQVPPEPNLLIKRIVADLHHFIGNAPQSDDQTLLAFRLLARDPRQPPPIPDP